MYREHEVHRPASSSGNVTSPLQHSDVMDFVTFRVTSSFDTTMPYHFWMFSFHVALALSPSRFQREALLVCGVNLLQRCGHDTEGRPGPKLYTEALSINPYIRLGSS